MDDTTPNNENAHLPQPEWSQAMYWPQQNPHGQQPYGAPAGAQFGAPPAAAAPHRHTGRWVGGFIGGVAAAVSIGLAVNAATTTSGSGTALALVPGSSSSSSSGSGSSGSGSSNSNNGGTTSDTSSTTATAAQQVGVVDINTVLKYQSAKAAGTGMILTSNGEILTNNHVIDGATSITVTVVTTGKTYKATVVGTDPTEDVAVLQLQNASGLQTVSTDTSPVTVGTAVTGVGNAGGVGGTPSAATGTVVATGQTITASDSDGSNAETLHDLIQTDAAVAAGDSGGPLYNSSGKVIGMDTAASTSSSNQTVTTSAGESYAIPIKNALAIAAEIESGTETSTIHIGYPAFLGVSLQTSSFGDTATGATIAGVLSGGVAANAGLVAGDVITAVGGHSVTSSTSLSSVLAGHDPGDKVTLTWIDTSGQSHTATVTLATGPAD